MKRTGSLIVLLLLIIALFPACQEDKPEQVVVETPEIHESSEKEIAYEEYMYSIEANDSLGVGTSLFYTKPNGESVEAEIDVNAEGQTVKLVEVYTTVGSESVARNIFYLKEGKKYISRELKEETIGEELKFSETMTFYAEDEKPFLSKKRIAGYEEELDFESFSIIRTADCSMKRVLAVLNQTDEFETTFQGFIDEDHYLYLIVGENKKEGFASSLIVQLRDYNITTLFNNEINMIGKPLTIEFEKVSDPGEGYEYQILLSATIR